MTSPTTRQHSRLSDSSTVRKRPGVCRGAFACGADSRCTALRIREPRDSLNGFLTHGAGLDSSLVMTTHARSQGIFALSVAALGVVFGDIGTSPIYAFQALFTEADGHPLPPDPQHIFGALSLVLWAVTFTVSIKYVGVLLRADNDGEGGELSLTALLTSVLSSARTRGLLGAVMVLGMCAAGLFYGDSLITPAISILSAVEGLEEASPALGPLVVPIALVLVLALFSIQRWGTGVVGRAFGPVMIVWFLVIATFGVLSIVKTPEIIGALSPHHALGFIVTEPLLAFFALGAVVLTVTGAEALYADMGHFGRGPIARAWFALVFPCLALNYLGQGALVLRERSASHPFYDLVPHNLQFPVVILATLATIIASQAVIAGAFSVSMQAQRLGLLPRLTHTYTSEHKGQVYVPGVNWLLCVGALVLILAFRSSQGLSSAYGIAVSGSFLLSTALLFLYLRYVRKWALWKVIVVAAFFASAELFLFAANAAKVFTGGWIPLVVSALCIATMHVWRFGANRLRERRRDLCGTWEEFVARTEKKQLQKLPGTVVYLHQDVHTPPLALLTQTRVNRAIHSRVVIAEVTTEPVPRVNAEDRIKILDVPGVPDGVECVNVHFGFKEHLDVPKAMRLLASCPDASERWSNQRLKSTWFVTARANLVLAPATFLTLVAKKVFRVMFKNQARASDHFHLPVARSMGVETDLRF